MDANRQNVAPALDETAIVGPAADPDDRGIAAAGQHQPVADRQLLDSQIAIRRGQARARCVAGDLAIIGGEGLRQGRHEAVIGLLERRIGSRLRSSRQRRRGVVLVGDAAADTGGENGYPGEAALLICACTALIVALAISLTAAVAAGDSPALANSVAGSVRSSVWPVASFCAIVAMVAEAEPPAAATNCPALWR